MNGKNIDNVTSESRSIWLKRLNGLLAEIRAAKPTSRLRIGIIGALGCSDVGDEAMLLSLIDDLDLNAKSDELVVFSLNPKTTENYVGIESHPTFRSFVRNGQSIWGRIVITLDIIETKLFLVLGKVFGIPRVWSGGWIYRVVYLLVRIRTARQIRKAKSGRTDTKAAFIAEHIQLVRSLDVLIYLGGAYLNSWHVKAHTMSFLLSADIAHSFDVPVAASGLNIGPFNGPDRRLVAKTISKFRLLGFRDREESFSELKRMHIFDGRRHYYSNDDAANLSILDAPVNSARDIRDSTKPYLAVHAHSFYLRAQKVDELLRKIAKAVDEIILQKDWNVLLIPMTFSTTGEVGSSPDSIDLKRLREFSTISARYFLAPDNLSPRDLKCLFNFAEGSIVTRHHAFVFSGSCGRPTVSICLDKYYNMKLRGVAGEYTKAAVIPAEGLESHKIAASFLGLQ